LTAEAAAPVLADFRIVPGGAGIPNIIIVLSSRGRGRFLGEDAGGNQSDGK
jgi:hypothetical protein